MSEPQYENNEPQPSSKIKSLKAKKSEHKLLKRFEKYIAKFSLVEDKVAKHGDIFVFHFEVVGSVTADNKVTTKQAVGVNGIDCIGAKINQITGVELTPDSKLWEFTTQLIGREINIGESPDIESYYGSLYMIRCDHKTVKGSKGEEKTYNTLIDTKLVKRANG